MLKKLTPILIFSGIGFVLFGQGTPKENMTIPGSEVTFEMALIPAGTLYMGDDSSPYRWIVFGWAPMK